MRFLLLNYKLITLTKFDDEIYYIKQYIDILKLF